MQDPEFVIKAGVFQAGFSSGCAVDKLFVRKFRISANPDFGRTEELTDCQIGSQIRVYAA